MRVAKAFLFIGLALALSASGAELTERRLAWAHYVGWTVPTEVSLPPADHYEFPVHERGEDAFRDEVRRALDMGLDGFFVDVIVQYRWRPGYFFNVESLLKAAEGTKFMVAPCLDAKTDVSNQVDQIVWMLRKFGDHPNYPRVGKKYALATYTYHEWTPQEWREMLDGCAKAGYPIYMVGNVKPSCGVLLPDRLANYRDVFDCCYSFAYTGRENLTVEEENRGVANWCKANGRLFMPCIHPGYIGAWLKGHNSTYLPFIGHDKFLRDFFSAMEAGDWLHFTSWNDNVETTLQPMASTPGNRALIRAATDTFKRLPPSAERIDVSFAYHREELPGTLIRIEAVRLPAQEEGAATVSGRLVGADGKTAAELPAKTLAKGWDRTEWLVPSTKLTRNPELTPEFTLRTSSGTRRATFPALAIRTPWIENQITVHAGFADVADVKGELAVARLKGGIGATLSFDAPAPVARAILYRNDRPAGQFRAEPQAPGAAGVPLLFRGGLRFELKVPNGRVVAAARRGAPKGYDGFEWDEHQVVCRPTALNYDSISAWVEAAPDAELVYSSDVDGERKFTLGELAKTRKLTLRNGGLSLQAFPDCTLRELPRLDRSKGAFSLNLLDRSPYSGDAFYVRFELSDGRIAETSRIRPFAEAGGTVRLPALETSITPETHPGAEGTPRIEPLVVSREFLTPEARMPVHGTKAVECEVASAALRREYWPLESDGRSAISDRWAFADKAKFGSGPDGRTGLLFSGEAKEAVKLPIRMWPMDAAVVELDIAPERICAGNVISRTGCGAAFTLKLLADGRLEATWSGTGCGGVWDVKCANTVAAVSSAKVEPGRWTHVRLVNDHASIAVLMDGKEVARKAYGCFRAYGPTTVHLGGEGYRGLISRLKIRPFSK